MTGRAALFLILALVATGAGSTHVNRPSFSVRVLRLVDHSRRAEYTNGTSGPRVLVTYVRVPTHGRAPYPLVVFAHGFALTPQDYTRLLDTWARAGYVVAAPVFPIERPDAPGGANRGDLVNEPGDLNFVASLLTATTSPLQRQVDPKRIAFAGQSDGGVAVLAATYDRRYRRRRVQAAVIMSGAPLGGWSRAAPRSPPLLAIQGTSDPLNSADTTAAYYRLMRRPKFLLWLLGAPHREPYTTGDRWAAVVDRATTAFLDHYLQGKPLKPLLTAGTESGIARIVNG